MLKEVVSEYLKMNREFSISVNNDTTINSLTPSASTQLKADLITLFPGSVINSVLICQSIDVRASITSVDPFVYPASVFDPTISSIQSNSDLLSALWSSPRRELDLMQSFDGGTTWIFRGAVALPNQANSGAYYYEQMLTIMTNAAQYPLQGNELLGVQLISNTWGLLARLDKILVTMNWELRHTIFTA
jgi:hypothetical protein